MDAIVKDVREDRRWQLEAKRYGEDEANLRVLRRIFQNEYYSGMKNENERREKWDNYLSTGAINDLVTNAKDLFELIENETGGVIKFVPGMRVWDEGHYRYVDTIGKGKKGAILNWNVQGVEGLTAQLYYSSDIETEIGRRVFSKRDNISTGIEVFGKSLSPEILNDVFEKYPRDFGTSNGMPRRVESAFNHIPSLKRHLKVKGFPYPHKASNLIVG